MGVCVCVCAHVVASCPAVVVVQKNIDWSIVDFSKAAARPLQRQRLWSLRVCAKLSAPLIIATGMFAFLYFNGVSTINWIAQDTSLSFTQAMRMVSVDGLSHDAVDWLLCCCWCCFCCFCCCCLSFPIAHRAWICAPSRRPRRHFLTVFCFLGGRDTWVCVALVQVEHDEIILYLTKSLMAANDTESDAFADHSLEAVHNMLSYSNELYVGSGFPGVLSLTPEEVRLWGTQLGRCAVLSLGRASYDRCSQSCCTFSRLLAASCPLLTAQSVLCLGVVQQNIILYDACAGSTDPVGCSNVFYGVMSKGLQATIQAYANVIPEILAHRGSANGDINVVKVGCRRRYVFGNNLDNPCCHCARCTRGPCFSGWCRPSLDVLHATRVVCTWGLAYPHADGVLFCGCSTLGVCRAVYRRGLRTHYGTKSSSCRGTSRRSWARW